MSIKPKRTAPPTRHAYTPRAATAALRALFGPWSATALSTHGIAFRTLRRIWRGEVVKLRRPPLARLAKALGVSEATVSAALASAGKAVPRGR